MPIFMHCDSLHEQQENGAGVSGKLKTAAVLIWLLICGSSAGTIVATWQFSRPVEASLLFEDLAMGNASKTVCNVFEPWSVHILQWHSGIRLPKEP
jgi:hypothetical protein